MTKKLNWKLTELPTASEVSDLVNSGVITAKEAKDILFSEVDDKDPTVRELKRQIEFLEGLVKELSKNRTSTVWSYMNSSPLKLPNIVYTSGTLTGSTSTGTTVRASSYIGKLIEQ